MEAVVMDFAMKQMFVNVVILTDRGQYFNVVLKIPIVHQIIASRLILFVVLNDRSNKRRVGYRVS